MIRALVVDDEKLARDRVASLLRGIEDIELIGHASSGVEAVRMIEELSPDLVLLDVKMPGMNGFQVLKALKRTPQIIFTTAFDDYAIQAFEVHAADYLLKPISRARFKESVQRARQRISGEEPPTRFQELIQRLDARCREYLTQLPVHRGQRILLLPVDQILWFEVEDQLVYAHVDADRYLTNFTLKELEERLDPQVMFRAHKSHLVNLKQVRAIVPWFGARFKLVMRDQAGSQIELSRSRGRELRARMQW